MRVALSGRAQPSPGNVALPLACFASQKALGGCGWRCLSGKHGFGFPLLADTDKTVASAYGTLGPLGFPRRSVFVIDGAGIIRYAHRAIAGLTFRPVHELVEAVRSATR